MGVKRKIAAGLTTVIAFNTIATPSVSAMDIITDNASVNVISPSGNATVTQDTYVNVDNIVIADVYGTVTEDVYTPIYLSDLGHIVDQSNAQHSPIKTNKNPAGGRISLVVDGQRTYFDKGYGAHAISNLVFDISEYTDRYNKVTARMGVDSSKGANGDGVKFLIYTSMDGVKWNKVDETPAVKGNEESLKLDLNVEGINFIKLTAHKNGNDSYDHAVYGDLKLVKDDVAVSPDTPVIQGLQMLEHYDSILAGNTVEENMANHKMTILQRSIVEKFTYGNLIRVASQSASNAEAIRFLMNNEDALNYFVTGGEINVDGSYGNVLNAWVDIYEQYGNELKNPADNNFNLRLAVSTSLAFANHSLVRFWIWSDKPIDASNRYKAYQDLVKSGKMDLGGDTENYGKWSTQQFKELPITMMRWVVSNRINDDEVMWLTDHALAKKDAGGDYLNAYSYIAYTTGYNYDRDKLYDDANKETYNNKFSNFTDYFNDYGTRGIYRLWMIFEEGAVCGGLAKTYANLANVFGRPSSVVGQPGHAATMTWGWSTANQRYEWVLQNDISGWSESGNEYNDRMLGWGNKSWTIWHNASYNVLATDAVLKVDDFENATLINILADDVYTNNQTKKQAYEKALAYQSINLDSFEGLINAYKADSSTTSTQWLDLGKRIINAYTYYPQVMVEMLALIETEMIGSGEAVQLDILKNNALLLASNATPEKSTNVTMSKQLANKYLGNVSNEVATFSFDGENAGKIVLNPRYEDSQIMVEYSLDGGQTWEQTSEHTIELTEEELASITAENDIKVSLVGTEAVYTIDITAGANITTSTVYPNDFENLLLGNVTNLEFSLDGEEWCDYVAGVDNGINQNTVSGIRFDGNQTVKVRYKANGTQLQSAEVTYTFSENTDTDTRKYVQLKNVKFVESSAHQGGHNPEQLIDGKLESGYHSPYGSFTNDKFYVVEFDKPRYISSMEYVFAGGNNGRMKAGTIQASMDGVEWTVIKEFADMPRGVEVTTYNMDAIVEAKFIKIVPTETHGNTNGETNKFFSGKELRFFEDTTQSEQVTEEEVTPDSEGWLKTTTLGQVEYLWDYEVHQTSNTVVLKSFKGMNAKSSEVKVELPKEVEGYRVVLANLNNDMFKGVTHIRIEEDGTENTVGLSVTSLANAFKGNDTLQYVNLQGLDVSKVTDMSEMFSMCDNLRFIKILDWEIQDDTNITGMFYARKDAADDQKKILVVANHYKIDEYFFGRDNRIPHVVTYDANGGSYGNGIEILNMEMHRYVIGTDNMDELVDLPRHDEEFAGIPTRDGYEFKGWVREGSAPTNVFELINMTYKAEWEEIKQGEDGETEGDGEQPPVEEPEQPETPDEDFDSDMNVDPDRDQVVDDGTTTLPDDVPVEDNEDTEQQPPVDTDKLPSPPNYDVDDDMGVVEDGGTVEDGTNEDNNTVTPEEEKPVTPQPPSNGGTVTPPSGGSGIGNAGGIEDVVTPDNENVNAPSEDDNSDNVGDNNVVVGELSSELNDISGHWAEKAIEYVVENRIFNGVTPETFEPNANMTRAMLVTVLHRLSGEENVTRETPFIDVKEGAYFEEAVKWAYNNDIVKGGALSYKFDPNKQVTRQEIAVMFDRYLQHMNVEVSNEEKGHFADENLISEWSLDSVKRIYGTSIMTGKEGNRFDPLSPATRAEVATIIYRLMNK